jgi:beta-glucanase (GH16 family)
VVLVAAWLVPSQLLRDEADQCHYSIAVPLALHFTHPSASSSSSGTKSKSASNSTSAKGTGAAPNVTITNFISVIDKETPQTALTSKSVTNTSSGDWVLVFSDEFNTPGRSFYPGDDPFWEAGDLHYWQTGDLEWYDPGQVTTANGSLVITLEKVSDPLNNHNLTYKSAMVSTWNKVRESASSGRCATQQNHAVLLHGRSR